MEKTVFRGDSRGFTDQGWLKSHHSFSFGDYYDPKHMHYGKLRVLNDDIVAGGKGFASHSHQNMEIISIPLMGALAHKDSTGRNQTIHVNDVQIMSAGTGVQHSEYNPSSCEPVNFLQIWILPKTLDILPCYDQKTFSPSARCNQWQPIVAPNQSQQTLWMNQDAYLYLGDFEAHKEIHYSLNHEEHLVYCFVIEGELEILGETLKKRDAMGIKHSESFTAQPRSLSKLLLIEIPA